MNPASPLNDTQLISWNIEDGIGRLVLNRPPSNSMTTGFFDEMNRLIPLIAGTSGLRGIIVTGAGRHFSSGADLGELLGRISAGDDEFLLENTRSMSWFEEAPVPVVAAVRGVCIGSAFELALLCHFRICSEDAVFGLPESTFNLMPGIGGIRKVKQLSGKALALDLALRGRTFSAGEALETGLIDRIVPKKELLASAVALIHALSPGYRREKRSLYLYRYLH